MGSYHEGLSNMQNKESKSGHGLPIFASFKEEDENDSDEQEIKIIKSKISKDDGGVMELL
jgi:hypothetical protein